MATVAPRNFPINYILEIGGLKDAIDTLLGLIQTSAQNIGNTDSASIERDNDLSDYVTDLYSRIRSVELIVDDYQAVLGLSPDQVATLTEAAGFLINADGTATTLKNLIDRLASFVNVTDALQSAIDAINAGMDGKASAAALTSLVGRVTALESATVDLSGVPTIQDLNALYSSTGDAFIAMASALSTAAAQIKTLVNGFTMPPTQHLIFRTPSTTISGISNSGGAPI